MSLSMLLVASLTALLTWNNYSLLIGGLTASGSATYRRSLMLVLVALTAGILAEGWKMDPAALSVKGYEPALLSSVVVFSVSTALNVPVSISNVLVVALSGSTVASGFELNLGFLSLVIFAWLISPIIAMVFTWSVYNVVRSIVRRSGLLALGLFNKSAAYIITFYASYTLAANNIGFMLNMIPEDRTLAISAVLLAAFAGAAMTRYAYVAMGEDLVSLSPQRYFASVFAASLVLWSLTQLGIPAALTQLIIGAFLGAIASSTVAIYNRRRLRLIVLSWIATAALSFPLAYYMALLFI